MKKLIILFFPILFASCSDVDIEGHWKVIGINGDSVSISGYGDLLFKPEDKVDFINNEINILSNSGKVKESYYYELENEKVVIIYSDYGIPLFIKPLDREQVILFGGGMGNSMEEQAKSYFIIKLEKIKAHNSVYSK